MKPPLRLVLDTNVVLSALLWHGKPAELLDLGETDYVRLFTSQTLLEELQRSLAKPRLVARLSAIGLTSAQHASNYASLAELVIAAPLPAAVSRDRDDDHVLACAIAAGAAAVVTGDDDLLVLGAYQGIAMLRVTECLAVVAAVVERSEGWGGSQISFDE